MDANVYKLTFKVAGWRDGDWADWMSAALYKNGSEVETVVKTPTMVGRINQATGDPFILLTYYLTVSEAGNYVLKLFTNKHTAWTDFNLVKAPEVTANMTVKANKFGTFIAPFNVTIPSGIEAYTIESISGSSLNLTEVETTISANTPVILKNTTGEDYNNNFTGATLAEADSYTANYLTGVYTAATIAASDGSNTRYVLQTQGGVQAFYKVDADFTATANRCYLTVPVASNPVKAFFLDFGGEDAINGIEAETENAEIFNLAGQRMSKAQKGIYIVNGKKVLVK